MDFKTENVDFSEEVDSGEEVLDSELKIEKLDEEGFIKTEVFQDFQPIQIIWKKKQKNKEISNLETKKIKEEFVVFKEIDEKEKPQEIKEIYFDDSNNQVINKNWVIILCIQ